MDTFTYVLDLELTILNCSENWDAFALENQGCDIFRRDVVGTNLMRWIADEDTRRYYRDILAQLNHDGDSHILEFRCDSPDARRLFECHITRFKLGYIFSNTLLQVQRLGVSLAWEHVKLKDPLQKCSLCSRYRLYERWRPPEEVERQSISSPIRVIYTVCQDCALLTSLASR